MKFCTVSTLSELQRISAAVGLLALIGCAPPSPTSTSPLTERDQGFIDSSLMGTWRIECLDEIDCDDEFLIFSPEVAEGLYSSHLGGNLYLNVPLYGGCDLDTPSHWYFGSCDAMEMAVIEHACMTDALDECGCETVDTTYPQEWLILKYDSTPDRIRIRFMNEEFVKEKVRDGRIQYERIGGETLWDPSYLRITSQDDLRQLVLEDDDRLWAEDSEGLGPIDLLRVSRADVSSVGEAIRCIEILEEEPEVAELLRTGLEELTGQPPEYAIKYLGEPSIEYEAFRICTLPHCADIWSEVVKYEWCTGPQCALSSGHGYRKVFEGRETCLLELWVDSSSGVINSWDHSVPAVACQTYAERLRPLVDE